MHLNQIKRHQQEAKSLYSTRQRLLNQTITEASKLARIDHRLRINLYALSRNLKHLSIYPDSPEAAFVYLGAHQFAGANDHVKETIQTWFMKETLRSAVHDSCLLFPLGDQGKCLVDTYYLEASMRAPLLKLWLCIANSPLQHFLSQELSDTSDPNLQSTAIHCAAHIPHYTIEHFRRYYRILFNPDEAKQTDPDILLSALWGGLLHGETHLSTLANVLAKHPLNDQQHYQLMSLLALIADDHALETLTNYAQEKPNLGLKLLALSGKKQAADSILMYLSNIKTTELAADAWFYLTGQALSRRAHLKSTLPDVDEANCWWKKQNWQSNHRYLLGKLLCKKELIHHAHQYVGEFGQHCMNLLMLEIKPFYISPISWVSARQKKLEQLTSR